MANFDFSAWLANINLKPAERAEALAFIKEAQFTYDDLADCTLDFAKQFFNRENLPTFCIAALFRIQKAISDLKHMEQPQQEVPIEASAVISAQVVQQQLPPAREEMPEPPPEVVASEPAVEDPSSAPPIARWTTNDIISWLRSCDEMIKIKLGTLEKIIALCQRLNLTGAQLLEGDISKKYKEEFKEISLGGKHKLRKAIKALIAGKAGGAPVQPNPDQPSPRSDPSNAPPAMEIPPSQPPPSQHQQPQPQPSPPPKQPVQVVAPAYAPQHDVHQSPAIAEPIAHSAHPGPAFQSQPTSPMYHPEEEKEPANQGFYNPVPNQMSAMASPVVQQSSMVQPAVNSIASHPAPVVSGAMKSHKRIWYWYHDDVTWYPYGEETSAQIEAAYKGSDDSVPLTSGSFFSGRLGQYGIKFDRIGKVHYQINYHSGEQRPVVSGDHEMLHEMHCAPKPLHESIPAPATVPVMAPQQPFYPNPNAYGGNAFGGQYQMPPQMNHGGYVQQQPAQYQHFGGGAQPFPDSNFSAPGGGH